MPKSRRQQRYTLGTKQRWRCFWCQRPVRETADPQDPERATLDHLLAKSRGGTYALTNLVLACAPCNSARGAAAGAHVRPPEHVPQRATGRRRPLRDACVVCGGHAEDGLYCPRHR